MTDGADWERVVTTLVRERGDALLRYAVLLTGNPDDAADLVQDSLVRTFGRLRNGFSVDSAEAYVRRAIANAAVDRGRRRMRWRRIVPLAVTPSTADAASESADERLDVSHALRRLSPRERACVVLRFYDDLLVDDVARTLGISSGAVKRYLSDAMSKLADVLGERPSDDHPMTGVPHAR